MGRTEKFEKALQYATKKHEGQCRIGGEAYISHPIAVAEALKEHGYDEEYQIAGLFHDLLEDTDATEAEIERFGSKEILEAVKLLTKEKNYVMEEYIAGIKQNKMAFAVKGADRLHNLQSAFVADEKFRRKYVLESLTWYMDFDPRIPEAVRNLERTYTDSLSQEEKD